MPTDSATASATDPTTGEVKRTAALMQAYRLREVAFRFALDVAGITVEKPSEELCARARDFAACVKAWSDTNVQARIERGKPLPGSLRPERKTTRKPRASVAPIARASTTVAPSATPVEQAQPSPSASTDSPAK